MYIKVEECKVEKGNVKYVFNSVDENVQVASITLAKTFETLTQMRRMTYADCGFTVAVFTDVNDEMFITRDDFERIC